MLAPTQALQAALLAEMRLRTTRDEPAPLVPVGAEPYPPVLATTAVADDRVGYWEPAKWIARLRERSTSGRPMLLRTGMTGGHAGGAAREDELARDALFLAFAICAARQVQASGT